MVLKLRNLQLISEVAVVDVTSALDVGSDVRNLPCSRNTSEHIQISDLTHADTVTSGKLTENLRYTFPLDKKFNYWNLSSFGKMWPFLALSGPALSVNRKSFKQSSATSTFSRI